MRSDPTTNQLGLRVDTPCPAPTALMLLVSTAAYRQVDQQLVTFGDRTRFSLGQTKACYSSLDSLVVGGDHGWPQRCGQLPPHP